MMLTTRRLKNQGKLQFAELFEKIFPYGIELEKVATLRDYRAAIKARIFNFECDEKFYIRCRCESCVQDRFVQVWDIAEALTAQSPIDCHCGQGGLIPVVPRKDGEAIQQRGRQT